VAAIGISGHRGLPARTAELVDGELRQAIARHASGRLVGVTCLADGADQLFARAILDAGGGLHAIVAASSFRAGLPAEARVTYDEMVAAADTVEELPYATSDSTAHMAASLRMLSRIDLLLAVWDGKPARAYGGTADVVRHARRRGLPVVVIWPEGAVRD
jgi:hypothetical protein